MFKTSTKKLNLKKLSIAVVTDLNSIKGMSFYTGGATGSSDTGGGSSGSHPKSEGHNDCPSGNCSMITC